MDGESSAIDSSSDKLAVMDQLSSPTSPSTSYRSPKGDDVNPSHNPISSSGADMDEESETDELTIDDSCINNDDMMDDENNVAIVSSSTLHQMNEDEEEHEDQDRCAGSSDMGLETESVAVTSQPLHDDDDDDPMNNECDAGDNAPEQIMVSTSTASAINQDTTKSQKEDKPLAKKEVGDSEDIDVDIDGIEEPSAATSTPASPQGPESPPMDPEPPETIGSPDGNSQPSTVRSPSPPKSPDHLQPSNSEVEKSPLSSTPPIPNSQTETITSQEDFSQSQLDTSLVTLSTVTSQSSIGKAESSSPSQDIENVGQTATVDEDVMDTSNNQVESPQKATRSSPTTSEIENEESQQSSSSIAATSEKLVSNGAIPKSRSKSRSRSNTDDGGDGDGEVDDADLEDGEIMDDEEEEPKVPVVTSSKDKKDREKDRSSKTSSGSSHKDRSSEKERSNREKEKEREREKDKHRKDKKRSKREEEEKKEKEKEASKKNKKRKASDTGESEQEEYLFIRGASPGSAAAAPPPVDAWNTPVEEFGDDSKVSRAKRRRESDGESSPHHHHHSTNRPMPVHEPSPPAGRRPDNRSNNKRPGRDERKEPKSDVICAYFMQGKCQKSATECTFSHDATPPRKMELCKFWMMECCAKKEKCLYLHNDFPCKFYHTGLICKAGDRCKFSHSPLSEGTKNVLLKHIETAPKEILGDFPRLNRQGAINLINKMEAKLRGEKFDDDNDGFAELNQNDHHGRGPMQQSHHDRHHGHGGHGHGRNDDRHQRSGRDHHGNHGHHGHMNQRGNNNNNNNDMRGGPGRMDDRHHHNNQNQNQNNRSSRWEQQQPTRGDQEKLQELMEEAGISGFYKDTLQTGVQPPLNQPPPGSFPPMQPPLLPLNPVLMSQMLPGLLPHTQPNSVNNPALANVLASLSIPSTSIAPPTTLSGALPPINTSIAPPNLPAVPSQTSEDSNHSSDGKTIPDHLPKMQQELFKRIQKQQQKNEQKMQNFDKPDPDEQEENWYSSEDEEESKKKESSKKTEISDKISSVLNQIRQQNQPQTSSSPVLPSSLPLPPVSSEASLPSFYRDTDFRNQPSSFQDIDLRNPSSIFKKIDIEPAKEINASLAHNGPFPYKLRKVGGVPKIDYSSVRLGLPPSSIVLDPRLGAKRNNSIPAPASPTETSAPDIGVQPLTIPDGTPVFDPRTLRAGGGSGSGSSGRHTGPPGITPQQNNPFLDSDNRFVRDPRGGGSAGGANQPGSGAGVQAQNIAAMAAAMAAMSQGLPPNMQTPGLDPNLLMLGFPFLPQQPGGVQNPLDFQQMLAGGGPGGNLRMRPPFTSQQPPTSSWERLNQGQQGQGGDLTPPL